jgi:ADP-ribose pyrophosphatase
VSGSEVPNFEILSTDVIYQGRVFDVERLSVRLPNGAVVERGNVRHPGATAIVALADDGRWLLVRQYRLPAGQELLEVPAGTLDPGEAPEVTAARELREETGFAAGSLVPLGGTWMVPGYCTEYIHYYLATNLRPDPLPHDDDEHLSEPLPMTYDQMVEAIDDGRIQDAKTIVAMMLFDRHRRRHEGTS